MPVPEPPDETAYIKDKTAAVKLGKALFWDMQAGSDGRTACATCHYNAGADNRSRNQINPRQPAGVDPKFDGKGPNEQLTADDFPFHKLADPNDRASQVMSDTANVAGSQGVKPSVFDGITPGEPADDQHVLGPDALFSIGGTDVRRTTGRNTPSVINAVFNFRNFWDGRAQNDFNGVDPFGSRSTDARVGKIDPATGQVEKVQVDIANSSLASQAVGPPGNSTEMSADGRTLSDIGTKLLSLRPLRTQIVSPKDSVLGADVDSSGRGIGTSYEDLVKQAFQPDWWNSDSPVTGPRNQDYSLMAFNFPLFWGLAIQSYEATLVSDQTPADRFFRGDANALTPAAQHGLNVFETTGKCTECHNGPALTEATTLEIAGESPIEMDKAGNWIDTGFLNIGVRPTADDGGIGGNDGTAAAKPLSIAKLTGQSPLAVDGAFKIPGLRNVELTAPYFHNGGEMTLRQVVDFYSRGGNFDNVGKAGDIEELNLSEQDKDDLVEFLKALTDPRVKQQSAPFDHPELYVPAGEKTDASGNVVTENGAAADCFRQVPATGAGGGEAGRERHGGPREGPRARLLPPGPGAGGGGRRAAAPLPGLPRPAVRRRARSPHPGAGAAPGAGRRGRRAGARCRRWRCGSREPGRRRIGRAERPVRRAAAARADCRPSAAAALALEVLARPGGPPAQVARPARHLEPAARRGHAAAGGHAGGGAAARAAQQREALGRSLSRARTGGAARRRGRRARP